MACPYKVSVIIPLLPEHRFSKKSLESVAEQSFRDFDVIFVDAGISSDFLEMLMEQSRSLGLSSYWVHDHRESIPILRNRGILESRSEYVAFHNYPDIMLPSRLEKGVRLLEHRSDLVLSSSPVELLEKDGRERPRSTSPSRHSKLWSESERMLEALMKRTAPLGKMAEGYHIPEATTITVRRAAILDAGLYDTRFSVTPWATIELSIRLYRQGSFERIGTPQVKKAFKTNKISSEEWIRSMEQMDLFYLILSWHAGANPDRETAQHLRVFRSHWLRYWSGWFFRYRTGRQLGIRLAIRALLENFLCLESWRWMIKSFFPQSHYPQLFWFEEFIESPIPTHMVRSRIGQILSSEWKLTCL